MNAPLFNELMTYSQTKLAFHMPGHKFGASADLNRLDLLCLDNTEAMGMDNLYEAEGIIKEAMTLMADFYGAKETLFLTNGSTAGILTSIMTVCKEGDQLIVARNAHHSVWSGLVLAGVTPIYVSPEYDEEEDILGEIRVESIEAAIGQYPNAKGVMIVSPTYEGVISDIKAIAEVVHNNNMVLIVDEAHGAHFVLGDDYPSSSINEGADLVINSMHKTLPTLTQSGLIHICSDRIKYEHVVESLRMIQTSSPSYMMMGLMDYVRCYIMQNQARIKQTYTNELINMRKALKDQLKKLKLIEKEHSHYDMSKVIISTKQTHISGYELEKMLNEDFNIAVEAALDTYIILMTTMADNKETLMRLQQALLFIDKKIQYNSSRRSINDFMDHEVSIGKNPREIFYKNKEWVAIEACVGRTASKNVMLYPPGIPIVCIGETIKEDHRELMIRFKDKIQGVKHEEDTIFLEVC